MSKRFYEVIVLGADLGPLLAAAVLAKRGFRVLVLGCGTPEETYEEEGFVLPRGPSYFGAGGTPIVRKLFADLGLSQVFKRRLGPLEPRYQVVLPGVRLDVTGDRDRYREECAREFPDAARAIEGFYERLSAQSEDLDRFLTDELPLPPGGFLERRRFQRALLQNPFGLYEGGGDVWGEVPEGHPFRQAVLAQVRFASHADPEGLTPMQVCRLHGSWWFHGALPEGGRAGLRAFLRERIALHTGEVALGEGIAEIAVRRGRAVGVRLAGEQEVTGAEYVVCGLEADRLPGLFGEGGTPGAIAATAAACRARHRLFTANLVVRRAVVPVGMARHVLFLADPGYPPVEDNLLFIEVVPAGEVHSVVCVHAFARADRVERDVAYPRALMERITRRLEDLFPFLDRHLLFRSSPWILPDDLRSGPATRVSTIEREARSPERMPAVVRPPEGAVLGLTCLPHRPGPRNLLLTGRDVIPGLGDEGIVLSAWAVARMITQKDPRRVRLRQELGSALEPS
jgi:phytoene dehydrogenase-like protein